MRAEWLAVKARLGPSPTSGKGGEHQSLLTRPAGFTPSCQVAKDRQGSYDLTAESLASRVPTSDLVPPTLLAVSRINPPADNDRSLSQWTTKN